MAMTIHVDIVSAEGEIHSGQAEMVYAPAVMGEVGIAPRHTPMVTRLKPGDVRVDAGSGEIKPHKNRSHTRRLSWRKGWLSCTCRAIPLPCASGKAVIPNESRQ